MTLAGCRSVAPMLGSCLMSIVSVKLNWLSIPRRLSSGRLRLTNNGGRRFGVVSRLIGCRLMRRLRL